MITLAKNRKLKPQLFWYTGSLIQSGTLELAIDDPGFIYGATVFTTLRVYHDSLDHPLTNWAGHCERLQFSVKTFGWQPPDWHRLRQGAELMKENWPVLRMVIFPDGRELITGRILPADLANRQQDGIRAWLADSPDYARSLPAHKTGNYLPAWLALQTALKQGTQEAILVDSTGNWLESSTGNLWGWRDQQWWTPPTNTGILAGLMRSQIVNWLKQHQVPVREEPWSTQLVKEFEALAYTNSVMEIIPIHTVLAGTTQLTYNLHHPAFQQIRSLWHI